jgi:hypothetical protein
MRSLRRVLAAITLALGALGIMICVLGVVGIWILRAKANHTVTRMDAAVGVGVQRASSAIQNVRRALEQAKIDVQRLSDEAANLGPEPEKNRRSANLLRKLVRERVGANLNDLEGRLMTGADAAAAIASLLQSMQELPMGRPARLDPDSLERATNQASQLAASLHKLQTALGEDDQIAVAPEVAAASRDVSRVLERCQTIANDWQADLDDVREQSAQLKQHILGWLTVAAILLTAVCAWAAVSQLSLCAHAWKWMRAC